MKADEGGTHAVQGSDSLGPSLLPLKLIKANERVYSLGSGVRLECGNLGVTAWGFVFMSACCSKPSGLTCRKQAMDTAPTP